MKEIKIFLASSEELKDERSHFGNFIRDLDAMYEKHGCRIRLEMWEDIPSHFDGVRLQHKYNACVQDSDIFVALFYTKAGQYTLEEYDTAIAAQKVRQGKPFMYVFCKELEKGIDEDEALTHFKEKLCKDIGHYWIKYNGRDSLHFHFLMQLLKTDNSLWSNLRVDDDGKVCLDRMEIAHMDNLGFAANNPYYQQKRAQLQELPHREEQARIRVEKYPDDPSFRDDLQKILDEKNLLKQEFEQHQQLLIDTAKRIAQLQQSGISDRMRRAMDCFEKGNVPEAIIILDQTEHDAECALADFEQSEALAHQKREIVVKSIEELLLKTSILMANAAIAIEERITKTKALYKQAEEAAEKIKYDPVDYSHLLYDYASFLYDYAFYDEALEILQKLLSLTPDKVLSYLLQGKIYYRLDMYQEALRVLHEALALLQKDDVPNNALIAETYNIIGQVLNRTGEYDRAIEQARTALKSSKAVGQESLSNSAKSFENIADSLWRQGNCRKALENYDKALEIEKKIYGEDSKEVAISYRNMGDAYRGLSDYVTSLDYYKKALSLFEQTVGNRHPETALTYGCIGVAYMHLYQYPEALANTLKGLEIREETLGKDNTGTAESYYWLGEIYSKESDCQDCDKALEYYNKARTIRTKKYGLMHCETLFVEYAIAMLYIYQENYETAVEYFQRYADTVNQQENSKPPFLAMVNYYLGVIYGDAMRHNEAIDCLERTIANAVMEDSTLGNIHMYTASLYYNEGDHLKSIDHCTKALAILQKIDEENDDGIAYLFYLIGNIYFEINDSDKALEYYQIALKRQKNSYDTENFGVADIHCGMAQVYSYQGDYAEAVSHYQEALEVLKNDPERNESKIAANLNNIGLDYYHQGNYPIALENYFQAVAIHEKNNDMDTLEISNTYTNIGLTYMDQGDNQKALDYFLKVATIREEILGVDHFSTINTYINIGLAYEKLQRYAEALDYLKKVLAFHLQNPETSHGDLAMAYDNVGRQYYNLGNFGEAIKNDYESATIREKYFGVEYVSTALSYYNLGLSYYMQRYNHTALEYFDKALIIYQKCYGPDDPNTQNVQAWVNKIKDLINNV